MKRYIFSVAALALLAAPAAANDSAAAMGAGGIVLTQNVPVRMAAEDLYVSPTKVRVRYEFVNASGRDVETMVAFPLPDLDTDLFNVPHAVLADDPVNFVGFTVTVNGKKVSFAVEQRAFYKGRDVTTQLASAGLRSPNVLSDASALERLPSLGRRQLLSSGLLKTGGESGFMPQWTVRTKFYWRQTFPAGKTTVIEHSYRPARGGSFFDIAWSLKDSSYDPSADLAKRRGGEFCYDAGTLSRIGRMMRANRDAGNGPSLEMATTDYILRTANNWQGPIGRFHLTLDKLAPDNVISLCWDGDLKKTGPTTFEFNATNFAPRQDIHMVVMRTGHYPAPW